MWLAYPHEDVANVCRRVAEEMSPLKSYPARATFEKYPDSVANAAIVHAMVCDAAGRRGRLQKLADWIRANVPITTLNTPLP